MGLSFPNPIDAVKSAYNHVEDAGEAVVKTTVNVSEATFNATEHAAVSAFHFESAVTKFALNKTFDGVKTVATTTVNLTGKGIDFIGDGIDRLAHPGDPNPPAAQGLKFSQTKGASDLAYNAKAGERYDFHDGSHWKVVDVSEDKDSGFRAIALQPVDENGNPDPNDDRTIVAFAGTDMKSIEDWVTDAKQGVGLPSKQYDQAVDFTNKWKEKEGNDVILTGHSLGGGLAAYAAIKTDLHATAVNSAPLALNHLGFDPRDALHITQYYVPGEVLSVVNKANDFDIRPGVNIPVQGKYAITDPRSVINNHALDSVTTDIEAPTLDK